MILKMTDHSRDIVVGRPFKEQSLNEKETGITRDVSLQVPPLVFMSEELLRGSMT